MRRFINSIVLAVLAYSGPGVLLGAWLWLFLHAGFINAATFLGLVWVAWVCNRRGPPWAGAYAQWRIDAAMKRADARENGAAS